MRKDGAQQGDCEEGRSTTRKNALGWGPSINKIWAGNLGPVDLKLSNFCLNGLFKFKESHPVRNLILTSFTVWKSRNRRAITLEARWNPKCSRWKIAKRKVFVTKHLVCDLEGTSERPSITRILRLTWCRRMTNRGPEPRPYRGEKPLIRSAVAFIWAAGRSGKTRRNKGKTYKRTSEGLEGTREGRRWGVGKSRRRSEGREEEEVMGGKRKRGKGGMSQQAYQSTYLLSSEGRPSSRWPQTGKGNKENGGVDNLNCSSGSPKNFKLLSMDRIHSLLFSRSNLVHP